jgi:hypothetical protein
MAMYARVRRPRPEAPIDYRYVRTIPAAPPRKGLRASVPTPKPAATPRPGSEGRRLLSPGPAPYGWIDAWAQRLRERGVLPLPQEPRPRPRSAPTSAAPPPAVAPAAAPSGRRVLLG